MSNPILLLGASSAIAQKTAEILQANGFEVIGISTKPESGNLDHWYTVDAYTETALPHIDTPLSGMIYFPGSIVLKPFHRHTEEEALDLFTRHVFGAMASAKKYYPNLKQSPGASVAFISSVAATTGMPFHGLISPAKAALEGLTLALAAEWTPSIRVNAVAPSLVDTPMSAKFLDNEAKVEAMAKRNPMQKVGTPDDIAHSLAFLMSDKSQWMTGQVLAVDGGMGSLKL